MPRYTVPELVELSESKLVAKPEFKFSEFARGEPGLDHGSKSTRRRSSHHHARPTPVAIIPNHMLAASPGTARVDEEGNNAENVTADGPEDPDDELAAHYFLQRTQQNKHRAKQQQQQQQQTPGTQAIPLKYAAALAATSNIGREDAVDSESAVDDEEQEADGWVSVSRDKPRKKSMSRTRGSFSRWRRDSE